MKPDAERARSRATDAGAAKRGWRYAAAALAGRAVLGALFATVRFERSGYEHFEGAMRSRAGTVFVLWHGRLLPITYYNRGHGVGALISRSADGEYIARVVQAWGYVPIRGSSSRGGEAALRSMVAHLQAGGSVAVTPDGPRGPRQVMKPGALVAAQRAGVPVIPVSGAADRGWWFVGWDRFLVPKPFSRVHVVYGSPRLVPPGLSGAALEAWGNDLAAELDALTAEAERRVRGAA
jgi:lysophospholipid acyltransferase (LPLAT)-like uncharacterized protein